MYSSKVDSIIPKMNTETGQENKSVYFGEIRKYKDPNTNEEKEIDERYPVHYLDTTDKNGVKITIEAKKSHRQQYVDAVKSQMLYFDDIEVSVIDNGIGNLISYKANILYEDDLIVMSDNSYYSKPHLLLNKVNYGYIAWDELELEEKNGNIGIKVAPEDIEVNPSRESVLWTEKTKQKVLDRFNEVVGIAAGMIQEELKTTDFLQWLKTCYSVYSKYSERGGIVGRLAKIVDLSKAKFKFLPQPEIIFEPKEPLSGLFTRLVSVVTEHEGNKTTKKKVLRPEVYSMANHADLPVYLMATGERASNLRDKYLFTQHPGGFLLIMQPYSSLEEAQEKGASEQEIKTLYKGKAGSTRTLLWAELIKSVGVTYYKDVEVPEGFTGTDEEVEEIIDEDATEEEIKEIQIAKLTAAERRKQTGKTLIYPLKKADHSIHGKNGYELYEFHKLEIPIADINNWDASEIYYGYDKDSELLHFVSMIIRDPYPANVPSKAIRKHARDFDSWTKMKWWRKNRERVMSYGVYGIDAYRMQNFFDTSVMVFKVSQSNNRYYRDFNKIEEFFIKIQNKTITMSNRLIKWNTARIIRERLSVCAFLYNFPFNQEFSDMYADLCKYVDTYYNEIKDHVGDGTFGLNLETYNDMVTHLDNVYKFQQFVTSNMDNPEGTAELAEQLFGNKELKDGMAVDPGIVDILNQVTEFVQACGPMLNYIPLLTGYSGNAPAHVYTAGQSRLSRTSIPEDVEHEVHKYLEYKGVQYQQTDTSEVVQEHEDVRPKNEMVEN